MERRCAGVVVRIRISLLLLAMVLISTTAAGAEDRSRKTTSFLISIDSLPLG
jgi:hypothetical protein